MPPTSALPSPWGTVTDAGSEADTDTDIEAEAEADTDTEAEADTEADGCEPGRDLGADTGAGADGRDPGARSGQTPRCATRPKAIAPPAVQGLTKQLRHRGTTARDRERQRPKNLSEAPHLLIVISDTYGEGA